MKTRIRQPNGQRHNQPLEWTGPAERSSKFGSVVGAGPASERLSVIQLKAAASVKPFLGILAVLNLLAAGLFAILAFVTPLHSELSVRMAFTELDREGAINVTSLRADDPRYAFDPRANLDHRRTVPVYIAAAPLAAQRTNALVGLLISAVNAAALTAGWNLLRRRERTAG